MILVLTGGPLDGRVFDHESDDWDDVHCVKFGPDCYVRQGEVKVSFDRDKPPHVTHIKFDYAPKAVLPPDKSMRCFPAQPGQADGFTVQEHKGASAVVVNKAEYEKLVRDHEIARKALRDLMGPVQLDSSNSLTILKKAWSDLNITFED